MDAISLVISIASFFFSGFTFYWVSIRKRDAFYLVRIDGFGLGLMPQFAFANAGDYDVLITDIKCFFRGEDKTKGAYPSQNLHIHSAGSFLLEKGKLLRCTAEFQEPLSEDVVNLGKPDPQQVINGTPLHVLDLTIEVSWIRSDGESFRHQQTLYRYGLSPAGKIYARSLLPSAKHKKFLLAKDNRS